MLENVLLVNYFYFFLVPRDINERGRDLDQVLNQYMNFVKPAFEEFCSPVSLIFYVKLLKLYFVVFFF